MPQLHLLRPFSGWADRSAEARRLHGAAGRPIRTTLEALRYVDGLAERGITQIYTPTRRFPRRRAELMGGSMIFCRRGSTLFRMPIAGIRSQYGDCRIYLEARVIPVELRQVGFLRGWRYADDVDVPADVDPREIVGLEEEP